MVIVLVRARALFVLSTLVIVLVGLLAVRSPGFPPEYWAAYIALGSAPLHDGSCPSSCVIGAPKPPGCIEFRW